MSLSAIRSDKVNKLGESKMSKETLKDTVAAPTEVVAQFAKKLNVLVEVLKRTYTQETADGTNGCAMDAITEMLEHEFTATSKIRPVLNGLHKALYRDAVANLAAKRQAENDALKARAPKSCLPKRKAPESNEIDNPAALLDMTPKG